ncbi:MAG: phage tail-like protein, partial [Myxococcota bacterium]
GSYNFVVHVLGMEHALSGFQKCSAIKSKVETITWKNGTDQFIRKAPGRCEWEDVTLERVYSRQDELHKWWERIIMGEIDRRSVSISFMRQNNTSEVMRYVLLSAFPTSFELPELDATSGNAAIEKITLSAERVIHLDGEGYILGGGMKN